MNPGRTRDWGMGYSRQKLVGHKPIGISVTPFLVGWFDASTISGLSDTDPITTWNDVSSGRNHVTGSGANRPLYRTAQGPNALATVQFDGINDRLSRAVWATPPEGDEDCTVFTVVNCTDNTPFFGLFVGLTSGVTECRYGVVGNSRLISSVTAGSQQVASTELIVQDLWYVVAFGFRADAATQSYVKVRAFTKNVTGNDIISGPLGYANLSIGARIEGGIPFAGYISEVRIYNAFFSEAEAGDLMDELNTKWGGIY
jgi:hypothetical protein